MGDTVTTNGDLVPLPVQPVGVSWPTTTWPEHPVETSSRLSQLVDLAFDPSGPLRDTYAVVVVHGGRIVVERYGGTLPRKDGPGRSVGVDTPLLSWSVAKSMLHAVVGMLVMDGRLDPAEPAAVDSWHRPGDPRRSISLDHLLTMRDGLEFAEDYDDPDSSDVLRMLFGPGRNDMARFAADRELAAEPGSRFNYSTGSSLIVSGIVARAVGAGPAYRRFLSDRLFGPLGMESASATLDPAGTWVAGSFVHATARDYAKFGLLYLRDGHWDGRRLLPEGWVDAGRTPRSVDPDDGHLFGAHWWTRDEPFGSFWAAGHDGQYIDVCPALDAIVVRLGRTGSDRTHFVRGWRDDVLDAVAESVAYPGGS